MLVSVDEANGTLSIHGEVNHSSLFSDVDQQRYWWNDQSIRRSIFMGDYVYAISAAGVTATHLETLVETARIAIPHESQYTTEPIVSEESREDDATVDADSDRA